MYSESYKQKVYREWLARGSPWFSLDSSKDPTYEERQVIIEIKKREAKIKPKAVNEVKAFNELLMGR